MRKATENSRHRREFAGLLSGSRIRNLLAMGVCPLTWVVGGDGGDCAWTYGGAVTVCPGPLRPARPATRRMAYHYPSSSCDLSCIDFRIRRAKSLEKCSQRLDICAGQPARRGNVDRLAAAPVGSG